MAEKRFPSPFEVKDIPGTEGWRKMYPYYYVFSEDRKEYEESQFWFWDAMHHPDPMLPFDCITAESWWVALSQNTSRIFAIPPALGIAHRIVNGYTYISAHAPAPELIPERVKYFEKRVGFYYEKWESLYAQWEKKMRGLIDDLKAIEIPELPMYEPDHVVFKGLGYSSAYTLLEAYDTLILNMYKAWQYHFEFLNLVYLAYLTFFGFCKEAFPDIGDQTIAKMVSGADVIMFRPEEEIGKLARLAVDLGLAGVFKKGLDADKTVEGLKQTSAGRDWLDALDKAKDPWFYVSTGTGFYHTHIGWIDDLNIPFDHIRTYIPKVEKGESITRPLAEINAERERIVAEYEELLPTEEDKKKFKELHTIVRRTYPYAENHLFYVEHWHHTIWWNKIRELGQLLVNHGFLEDKEDIFYFHRFDIPPMLYDLVTAWAVGPGVPARGPKYWSKEVKWRKEIFKKFRAWAPPPALGPTPDVVTEPFTIMLWGVTTDTVKQWLAPAGQPEKLNELRGMPASPGMAEGKARVILEISELSTVQPGEILVCPITSPSWAPLFTKIKAVVTDIGGMTCHAAIVSREYRLPAVVGTGYATKAIKTGDKLKVNADEGVVYIER